MQECCRENGRIWDQERIKVIWSKDVRILINV